MTTGIPITEAPDATVSESEEEKRRLQREKNRPLIDLLDSWLNETDPEVIREQQETWAFLKQALDEDRLSYRKLFPEAGR